MSEDGWREPWWIPDESPGGIGSAEVWIDAHALDHYGGQAPHVIRAMLLTAGNGAGGPWIGQQLQFGNYPGASGEIVYMVVARRHSGANSGRPYYVARVRDD